MQAKKPGRRYRMVINTTISANAIRPASTMALRLFSPKLGLTVE